MIVSELESVHVCVCVCVCVELHHHSPYTFIVWCLSTETTLPLPFLQDN